MSKSYRNDAKNDKLRREKQNRNNQKRQKTEQNKSSKYSPFDDSPEYHEQFA